MRYRAGFARVLAAVMVMAAGPATAQPLNLELEGLLRTNPQILAKQQVLEAARAGVTRAYSGYLPRLDVSGEFGYESVDSPLASDVGGGSYNKDKEVAGVKLTQRLFDGYATPSDVRSARLNVEVAEFTAVGTRQQVLFEGVNAYIEVLRQQRLVELARDSERTIMQQLHLEDERVQRGAGIAVDVLQAKSRLQLAKERRIAFEGGLKDAITRYIQVFNHPPDVPKMIPPVPPADLLPDMLDGAIDVAEGENPAVDASLATVEVAAERRRLARSGYYPTVNVVASADRERNVDLVQGTRKAMSVMLQTTWNLFNGFATQAGVTQAAHDYRAAQDNHESVRRKVIGEIRLAWDELVTAQQRVELLDNAVAIATEVFDARRKLREAGRETVINVLDAENELYNARINLTSAEGDRAIAVYRVLQGMGRLDRPALGIK